MRSSLAFASLLLLLPAPALACSDAGPRNAECNDGGAAWIECDSHADCPSGQLCDVDGRCACGSSCAGGETCDGGACRCALGDAPDGGPGCETMLLCGDWLVVCDDPDGGGPGPEGGTGMDGGAGVAPPSGGCAASPGESRLPWAALGLLAVAGVSLARARRRG